MDSQPRYRVPREILILIMRYAIHECNTSYWFNNEVPWRTWVNAFQGDAGLKTAILAEHFTSVTISWWQFFLDPKEKEELQLDDDEIRDMLAAMGAFDETVQYPDHQDPVTRYKDTLERLQDNDIDGTFCRELMHKDNECYAAELVRNLDLDLSMTPGEQDSYFWLSHRTIQRTVDTILLQMKSLRQLDIHGPTSDTIFNVLSSGDFKKLEVLYVGPRYEHHPWIGYSEDPDFDIYDWTKLSKLKNLSELTVRRLSVEECCSFRRLVPNLPRLHSLDIAVENPPTTEEFHQKSPLQLLFGSTNTRIDSSNPYVLTNLLAWLPSGFRKLALRDAFYFGDDGLQVPDAPSSNDVELSQCSLEEISIDIDSLVSLRNILQWLPKAALKRVSFCPASSSGYGQTLDEEDPLTLTNRLIAFHGYTLQEICFNNVWKMSPMFVATFNRQWAHKFEITDLIICACCPPEGRCIEVDENVHVQDFTHLLFGCFKDTDRWGSSLQRVRLDLRGCTSTSTSTFLFAMTDLRTCTSMQRLRILAIECCRVGSFRSYQDVADSLADNLPTTLRVIQLDDHFYWIDHDSEFITSQFTRSNRDDGTIGKARSLYPDNATLYRFGAITRRFRSWQTREDVEFMDPQSRLNSRRNDHCLRSYADQLDQNWLQSFSFLLARQRGNIHGLA